MAVTATLVLVHGGAHTSRCWQPTVDALAAGWPSVPVLAVDLPGRDLRPGAPDLATIETFADRVIEQISAAGAGDVVLVGHSLAGLTVPAVAARLGAGRVRRLVLVSACVPAQGGTAADTLQGPLRPFTRWAARRARVTMRPPRVVASAAFCNGMAPSQRALVHRQLCGESSRVLLEPVDRRRLPAAIPRTWVLLTRDRAFAPAQQRAFMAHLGGVDEVVPINACHDVMVSHPYRLAAILAGRATQRP